MVAVQLPGGERVPFLFTIKELAAKGTLDGFGGDFMVPSYRGSSFLDPKVLDLASTPPPCLCHSTCTMPGSSAAAGGDLDTLQLDSI